MRLNRLQRGDNVAPEGGGVVISLVQRDPRRRVLQELEPLRQQRRLAEARRRGDERQLRLRAAIEALAQSRTWDQTAAQPGEVELGREQRTCHDQSRNAPTVKPWINHRCSTANTTSGGIVASARPA